MPIKNIKHKHGTPNPVVETEERLMLATVDRALTSSGNSQTIGRSGEIPIQSFLSRHLPNTFVVKSGHFMAPSGQLSPQIDILIIDSRYPLLAENMDGSVLAMLHSVIYCIEVKTNIRTTDLEKIRENSKTIIGLAAEVFNSFDHFDNVSCICFAYRTGNRIETLANNFFALFLDDSTHTDLYLLRVPAPDRIGKRENGAFLHLEPDCSEDTTVVENWTPTSAAIHTPLSDFYYHLIQGAYYCLDARNYSFGDIGAHIMDYMSWSTIGPNKE